MQRVHDGLWLKPQKQTKDSTTRATRFTAVVLFALMPLVAVLSGCGGNSTTAAVSISAAGQAASVGGSPQAPVTVFQNDTITFNATVSGISTTTVYWQICLPEPPTSPLTPPTSCTPIPGVTTTNSSGNLSGYGLITQDGVYKAPPALPETNPFEIIATSTVDSTAFGAIYVKIDSGIRIQMIPTVATIGSGEQYAIVANVTGSSNTAVTWSVADTAGGNAQVGTIVAGGPMCQPPLGPPLTLTAGETCATFTAPTTTSGTSATVTATSSADPSQSAQTALTIASGVDPAIASIQPSTAQQGSAQQDIYIKGSDLLSTSTVLVNNTPTPATWLSTSLMRVTIPASLLTQTGSLPIVVQSQNGDVSLAATLTVSAERPSVVASSPDSVITTAQAFSVNLTGGYFSPSATSATFNGFPGTANPGTPLALTFTSSRQIAAGMPAGALSTPGLYPIVVQNSGLAAGAPSTSFTNIAVTPGAGSVSSSPTATIAVGTSPSAIAVDQAEGLAVVANTGANSVSIINLATNAVVSTVAVGNAPTGVAVDDALVAPLHSIAVVVNSGDGTLSTIDLTTDAVTSTLTLPALPMPQPNQLPHPYYSIGINPATHRGIVAISSTNVAAIFDTATGSAAPPAGDPQVPLIGGEPVGGVANYGTGPNPQIAIDPRLNWAIVTAGGGGIPIVNMVDLGHDASATDPVRAPNPFGSLSLGSEVEGVGVNPETHQVLITTPQGGSFTTFSLLDQTVSNIPFTYQNINVNEPDYVAAAVSALPNIGVAVNQNSNTAAILDLQNHLVIQKVTVGGGPIAVAVDPATNEALVANQTDGTVSVLSLGTVRSSASGSSQAPQITLSAPEIGYVSPTPFNLTVNGGGFQSGAQVYLDGTPLTTISGTSRQIVAQVPATMLTSPRRYAVYVQNPTQSAISNIEDLTVVQAVPVGAQPFGVAIDTNCDVAAVTNNGDSTVSIVALTANSNGLGCVNSGTIGTVGPAFSVGTAPEGIAIDPILGMAVTANAESGDASIVDLTETNPPHDFALSCSGCTNITGVGVNLDTGVAYVTGQTMTNPTTGVPEGWLSEISLPSTGIPANATAAGAIAGLDATPQAVAVDPYFDYLGIAVGAALGNTNTVDVYNLQQPGQIARPGGFNLPTGIIFDPVNQVFVAANSLQNNVGFVDPITGIASFAQVGMNPTALDYNYQTSTLVTSNSASSTLSIIDYVCPPGIGTGCSAATQVRDILGLGGSTAFSVAVDPKLNMAVLTDNKNNRVLLIPLP
ncbi:MAG TPA: IPT/TIG domain-containing protein [Candidatus Acidoferrales bacterium]|nr:IPT/TIG domain-containing protein [Candidatus Acidoferrales bacterium]